MRNSRPVRSCVILLLASVTIPACNDKGGHRHEGVTAMSAAKPSEYNLPYVASRNTDWINNPNAPQPTRGKVKKGDRVYFNRKPTDIGGGASWQDAWVEKESARYFVRPYDFSPQ
jgi:hypothetical protein